MGARLTGIIVDVKGEPKDAGSPFLSQRFRISSALTIIEVVMPCFSAQSRASDLIALPMLSHNPKTQKQIATAIGRLTFGSMI